MFIKSTILAARDGRRARHHDAHRFHFVRRCGRHARPRRRLPRPWRRHFRVSHVRHGGHFRHGGHHLRHRHVHWHGHWRYRHYYYPRPVDVRRRAAVYAAAPVVNRCTCLTKEYTPEGAVLFKDICTNEAAINPPPAPQQTGMVAPHTARSSKCVRCSSCDVAVEAFRTPASRRGSHYVAASRSPRRLARLRIVEARRARIVVRAALGAGRNARQRRRAIGAAGLARSGAAAMVQALVEALVEAEGRGRARLRGGRRADASIGARR